jgi:hypothetical protein
MGAITLAGLLLLGCGAVEPSPAVPSRDVPSPAVPSPEVPASWTRWVTRNGLTFTPIYNPPAEMISAAEAEAIARREILKWSRPKFHPEASPLLVPGEASAPVIGFVACTAAQDCRHLWGSRDPDKVVVWVVDFPADDVFFVVEAQSGLDFSIFG